MLPALIILILFPSSVGDRPKIKREMADVSGHVGYQATLKCVYDNGGLDSEVTWFKGTRQISKSKKYSITQSGKEATLVIKDLQPADASEYTFEISNILGRVSCEGKVMVTGWYSELSRDV